MAWTILSSTANAGVHGHGFSTLVDVPDYLLRRSRSTASIEEAVCNFHGSLWKLYVHSTEVGCASVEVYARHGCLHESVVETVSFHEIQHYLTHVTHFREGSVCGFTKVT